MFSEQKNLQPKPGIRGGSKAVSLLMTVDGRFLCVRVHIYIYTYIYNYTYVYMYIYIYTHVWVLP